jgi:DNA-binding transcriptional MerR regulator
MIEPARAGANFSKDSVNLQDTKSPAAFRTISEVAADLELPQHVLRFWESKFSQIRPMKRGGGRRYYRPEDVKLLHHIRELLHYQGYTIKGVQKLLRESRGTGLINRISVPTSLVQQQTLPEISAPVEKAALATTEQGAGKLTAQQRRELTEILDELKALRQMLRANGV